jgi:predicted ferric reductase
MRLLRIIVFNPGHWSTTALASYSHSANIIRLNVPIDRAFYKPQAGNYFYLSILDDAHFWESHPFTVASISDEFLGKLECSEEEAPLLGSMMMASEADSQLIILEPKKQHMTFLIRPYDGFTLRLRDMLVGEQSSPKLLRMLVDGPYGHTQRLHKYQRVMFIAGGSGVVVALSYLNSLCEKMKTRTTIELHWAVRESAFVRDVLSTEAKRAINAGRLSLHLYMSSQIESPETGSLLSQVQQHVGRLKISSVVMSAARDAQGDNLAVVACGPAKMADDTRLAVVDALNHGSCQIDYYEESFTW